MKSRLFGQAGGLCRSGKYAKWQVASGPIFTNTDVAIFSQPHVGNVCS